MKDEIKESDLFGAVERYFLENGYEVKAELKNCDVMAVKDEDIVIIELKKNLNLEVILQASQRQTLTEFVYIAVQKKHKTIQTKKWENTCYLLRRLNIGLLVVNFVENNSYVEEVFHPAYFDLDKSRKLMKKKRVDLFKEFESRHGNFNVGGTTGVKLLTAYKELAIQIAVILDINGAQSIKEIREKGVKSKKVGSVLSHNYYGWFEKVDRGVYIITDRGKQELEEYKVLVDLIKEKLLQMS